jgi:pimeloyl-ACP methyl ester carboxylesterase
MDSIYKSEAGEDLLLGQYKEILEEWPVDNRQFLVDTMHGSTFVIESGQRGNPPLILLHGSVANSLTWMSDVETFSKSHHVFAVDIIGEAGFSAPNRPSYDSGAYAEWLTELIQNLELVKCSLVGLSLGGWMALEYATAHPDMVEKLILLCPGGIYPERGSFLFKALFYSLLGNWGRDKITALVNGGKLPNDPGVERAMSFTMLVSQHFRPRYGKLHIFRDADLAGLTMPIQIIFGEHDYLLRARESLERLKHLARNVDAILLPDTGHVITNQSARIEAFLLSPA